MKAAAFFECGGPEQIQFVDVPAPTWGPDEALIRVRACALNRADLWMLNGPPDPGFRFPFWAGADIAGVVEATGERVTSVSPGDRVVVNPGLYCGVCEYCVAGEHSLCLSYDTVGGGVPGGLADYFAITADHLLPIPDDVPFHTAAAAPMTFMTAWRALVTRAALRPGEHVLILGASGGVGTACLQIARFSGAHVTAITSSQAKVERLLQLGADTALNRNEGDPWKQVRDMTGGRGVDLVVESVGGPTWQDSLQSLAKGGRLVTFGRTAGGVGHTDIGLVFWNQLQIIGSSMSNNSEFQTVMQLVFQGHLQPVIDRVFPLSQARTAFERLQNAQHVGKILVEPS